MNTGDPRVDTLTLDDHLDAVALARFWIRGDLHAVIATLQQASPRVTLALIGALGGFIVTNVDDADAFLAQASENYRAIHAELDEHDDEADDDR